MIFSPSSTPLVDEDSYYYSGDGEFLFLETSWFLYAVAACAVLVVFTVFIVIVLLAKRCSRSWKAKISFRSTKCDYDDIVDRTIVELFEVLDKRSKPPVKNTLSSSNVIETDLKPHNSDSVNNTLAFNHQPVDVMMDSHPNSPNSVSSVNRQSLNSCDNTQPIGLKPLATKSLFVSNESVYDNLEDSEIATQETTDGDIESTFSRLLQTTYDDTVISPNKKDTNTHVSSNKDTTIYDDTVPRSPINEADYAAILDCESPDNPSNTKDEAGYYVLPDCNPPKGRDYSYSATHNLVPTGSMKGEGIGEIRSQSGRKDVSSSKIESSVYTNIDDVSQNTSDYQNIPSSVNDPTYSKIDEIEGNYLYATDHILVSPKRSNVGKVVVKPEGHHVYDPIIATKSKSLPGSHMKTTDNREHTYANLKQSRSVKERKRQVLEESNNPLYASSDDILTTLQNTTTNPLYDSTNGHSGPYSNNTRESIGETPNDKEKDYLVSTDTWLKPTRTCSMNSGHCTSQPEMTIPLGFDETDHTYMGIFVRDRVDHDYTVPKGLASSSSESGMKTSRDQRTYSLGNRKYENQSMWLRNMDDSSQSQNTSSGYMGLYGESYETNYTIPNPKHTFSHSQV